MSVRDFRTEILVCPTSGRAAIFAPKSKQRSVEKWLAAGAHTLSVCVTEALQCFGVRRYYAEGSVYKCPATADTL